MTKAMILAAGLGTRLRPLTFELPKPLLWVGDKPAVAHIAAHLVDAGLSEIVLNAHHLPEAFSPEVLAQIPGRIEVIYEPDILGTAGGIQNAAPLLGGGDVLIWNGDILAPLDVRALFAAHRGEVTVAACPCPSGKGTLGLDEAGRVVRLRGERFGQERFEADFLGISVLGERFRETLPAPGCLVGDGFLPWLRGGGEVRAFVSDLTWDDIGSLESYLAANAKWLERSGKPFFVGEGALIEPGVDIAGSVIGARAKVRGQGWITGCVVWPGAEAKAPLDRAVVTARGVAQSP